MAITLIKWYHNAGALEDRYYHPDIRKHVDIFHCDYCQHVKIPHKRIGLLQNVTSPTYCDKLWLTSSDHGRQKQNTLAVNSMYSLTLWPIWYTQ